MAGTDRVALTELCESLSDLRLHAPEQQQKMERSLSRMGQLSPLLVFKSAGRLEVINGFKRLRAARVLNWTELSISILEVAPAGAKVRLWQSNIQGGLCELEEAWLIHSLYRDDHLNQVQIGQLMGRHKSWVNRRLLLAESLCQEVQVSVRLGLISTTNARELCRLPRGNQLEVANVVTQRGLTTRQTARLVDAVMSRHEDGIGPKELLERIQAQARPSQPQKTRKRTPSEWLVADAESIRRLCARMQARLLERPPSSFGAEAEALCHQALRELLETMRALCQTIADRTQTDIGEHRVFPPESPKELDHGPVA